MPYRELDADALEEMGRLYVADALKVEGDVGDTFRRKYEAATEEERKALRIISGARLVANVAITYSEPREP